MILTRDKILNEIKEKRISITPFSSKNIGPASIDLTLSNEFRIFLEDKKVNIDEKADYKKSSKLVKTNSLVLKPGDFVLGITKEKISLPNDICGKLTGRSRFARLGLAVHITATFMQPGINNRQVLEIKNAGNHDLVLKAGVKVCQLIIERTEGKAKYKGRFKSQKL